MMRRFMLAWLGIAGLALGAGPAAAQETSSTTPLRPTTGPDGSAPAMSAEAKAEQPAQTEIIDTSRFGGTVPEPVPVEEPVETDDQIDPSRFGERVPDQAYGAYQRGLYKTAYNIALPRAESGDPAAQTLVAEILSRGLGTRRDEKSAAGWYQKAAEQGVPEAQFQYALMEIDGKYVAKDTKGAYALMQAAAEAGNSLAQFNLAQMMINRATADGGTAKAVDYYERAAKAGLADAQYALSQVYFNGIGGRSIDLLLARKWLTLAARQNYDTAQLDLGTLLVEGRAGQKDEKAGFNWLKRAALGGNVAAQNRVAKLYMYGIGTEPDSLSAAAWYILARRGGLVDPEMDDFMNGLTDAEQKKALERANRLR